MKHRINSKEYKIFNIREHNPKEKFNIYTTGLNDEIAFSLHSGKLEKVAMARSVDEDQFDELIKKINPENLTDKNLIQVRIFGGNNSEEAHNYLIELIEALENTNIVEIIGMDTCERWHENNIEVNGFHGGISAYTDS